jgi:hypothetical protein
MAKDGWRKSAERGTLSPIGMNANPDGPEFDGVGEDPGVYFSMPDVVPDDLVEHFGRKARHTVRYRQSRRFRLARGLRSQASHLRSGDVWMVAAVVFGCSLVGLALVGALVYAVALWPLAVLFLVLPVLVLLPLSLWVAIRITRKERTSESLPFGS